MIEENTKTQETATTLDEAKALAADWLTWAPDCEGPDADALRGWVNRKLSDGRASRADTGYEPALIECLADCDVGDALEIEDEDATALCTWARGAGWPS